MKVGVARRTRILGSSDDNNNNNKAVTHAHLGKELGLSCEFDKDERLEAEVKWTKDGEVVNGKNGAVLK